MSKGTKRLLVILAFVVGLSYFAFTLIFFDPFEGSYMDSYEGTPIAIEYAVPQNVDFFVHKRALVDDFDPDEFPVPKAWDDITLARNWTEFERSPMYKGIAQQLDLEQRVADARATIRDIPLLEPLDDLVGRDVAVFGRVQGAGTDQTQVAAVFLGSKMARFAYEAAGIGVIRSVLGIPIAVEEDGRGVRTITLDNGDQFFAYRSLDLFVVGTSAGLVGEVVAVHDSGRDGSLGYLRRYHATVAQDVEEFAGLRGMRVTSTSAVADRVQLYGRLPTLLTHTAKDEEFMVHNQSLSRWLLGRLFNPTYFGDITLDIGFQDEIDVRGMLSFSRERAEKAQTGFYNRRTFDLRQAMDRVAKLLPQDTYFVMAARLDMNKFLPTMINALTEVSPDARKVLDDLIQSVRRLRPDFRSTNAVDMVNSVASFIGDDIVIALKRDSYFGQPETAMPLVVMFLQVTDRGPSKQELEGSTGDPRLSHGYNGFVHPIMMVSNRLGSDQRGLEKWWIVTHKGDTEDERTVQDLFLKGTAIRNVSFGIIDPKSKKSGPWTLAIAMSPQIATRVVEGNESRYGSANELITDVVQLSHRDGNPVMVKDYNLGGDRRVDSLYLSQDYKRGAEFLNGFASVAMYINAPRMKEVMLDARMRSVEAEIPAGPGALSELARARREQEQALAWLSLFKDAFLAARIDEDSQNIELRAKIRDDLDD